MSKLLATVSGILTNDEAFLPSTDGVIDSYAFATGQFKVYYGATEVTNGASFSIVSELDCTGVISNVKGSKGVYSVSNVSSDKPFGLLTVSAYYAGSKIYRTFKVAKVYKGTIGEVPYPDSVYEIQPDSRVVVKSSIGLDPVNVNFFFYKNENGLREVANCYSSLYYSIDGKTWIYYNDVEQAYDYVQIGIGDNWQAVKCVSYTVEACNEIYTAAVSIIRIVSEISIESVGTQTKIGASAIASSRLGQFFTEVSNQFDNIDLSPMMVYIDTVDESALPWLAEQFDVEGFKGFDLCQTTEQKRAIIRNAINLHKIIGTVAGIKQACSIIGYQPKSIEENVPIVPAGPDVWCAFRLRLSPDDLSQFDSDTLTKLRTYIEYYKNARSILAEIYFDIDMNDSFSLTDDLNLTSIVTDPGDYNLDFSRDFS